ncbi:hypothetical protein DID78_00545 [Candidatus Marinamargulisbacteria bacterium SCGC AG-343-D04]|nr:hypothetical protein DID78_00545 [Candidatus Marinamargulisbacteria bacterium SCGC AG-343-D04]
MLSTTTTVLVSGSRLSTVKITKGNGEEVKVPHGFDVTVTTSSGQKPEQTISLSSRGVLSTALQQELHIFNPKERLKKVCNTVHYFWCGAPLTNYPSYLKNIAGVCKLKGNEGVTLWTDNITPQVTLFCKKNGINLCHLGECLDVLFSAPPERNLSSFNKYLDSLYPDVIDSSFQNLQKSDFQYLRKIYEVEAHKISPNYARMSDIVRLLCMIHFAGVYLDADVKVFNPSKANYPNISEVQFNQICSAEEQHFYHSHNNNDILATRLKYNVTSLLFLSKMVRCLKQNKHSHFRFRPNGYLQFLKPAKVDYVIYTTGPYIYAGEVQPKNSFFIERMNKDTDCLWIKPKSKFVNFVRTPKNTEDIESHPAKWEALILVDIEAQLNKKMSIWRLPQINLAKYELVLRHFSDENKRSFFEKMMKHSRCFLQQHGVPDGYLDFSIIDYDYSMNKVTDDPKCKLQQLISKGICLKYRLINEMNRDHSELTQKLLCEFLEEIPSFDVLEFEAPLDSLSFKLIFNDYYERLLCKVVKLLLKSTSIDDVTKNSYLARISKPFFKLDAIACACIHSKHFDFSNTIRKKFPGIYKHSLEVETVSRSLSDCLDDLPKSKHGINSADLNTQLIDGIIKSEHEIVEKAGLLKHLGPFESTDLIPVIIEAGSLSDVEKVGLLKDVGPFESKDLIPVIMEAESLSEDEQVSLLCELNINQDDLEKCGYADRFDYETSSDSDED